MWRVSSRSGVATLRTAMHLLLTYLLLRSLTERVRRTRTVAADSVVGTRGACSVLVDRWSPAAAADRGASDRRMKRRYRHQHFRHRRQRLRRRNVHRLRSYTHTHTHTHTRLTALFRVYPSEPVPYEKGYNRSGCY